MKLTIQSAFDKVAQWKRTFRRWKIQQQLKKYKYVLSLDNGEEKQVRIFMANNQEQPVIAFESSVFPKWESLLNAPNNFKHSKVICKEVAEHYTPFIQKLIKLKATCKKWEEKSHDSHKDNLIKAQKGFEDVIHYLERCLSAIHLGMDPFVQMERLFNKEFPVDLQHKYAELFNFKEMLSALKSDVEQEEALIYKEVTFLIAQVAKYVDIENNTLVKRPSIWKAFFIC